MPTSKATVTEEPTTKKINVNHRTSLAVFTGGIDSTYLLLDMKKKFKEVGAAMEDLIPVWFKSAPTEQLTAINNIAKSLGLTPLLIDGNYSSVPSEYLPQFISYALDNGISHLLTPLTNDESQSAIPDLDYDLGFRLETQLKNDKITQLMAQDSTTSEQLDKIRAFQINYPILPVNKHIIIKRMKENFKDFGLSAPFDFSQAYRSKVSDVILDKEKNVTVSGILDKLRKNAFSLSGTEDPLNPKKK